MSCTSEAQTSRSTRTYKCECPFKITCKKKAGIGWTFEVKCPQHNHPPAESLSAFPVARRLTREQKGQARSLLSTGTSNSDIAAALKAHHANCYVTPKDISNLRAAERSAMLAGRDPLRCLLEDFPSRGNFIRMKTNEVGRLEGLLFTTDEAMERARRFHDVFIIDATYKTNKDSLPLLHIVGIDCFFRSFTAAVVFLENEVQSILTWALEAFSDQVLQGRTISVINTDRDFALMNAVSQVLPFCKRLLCIWHINKNIQAKCKAKIEKSTLRYEGSGVWEGFLRDWNSVVHSETAADFHEGWERLVLLMRLHNLHWVEAYISATWIPHHQSFVKSWADDFQHLGSATTSRAEGMHAALKKTIQTCTKDLLGCCGKIESAMRKQFEDYKHALSVEKNTKPTDDTQGFFRHVYYKVTMRALKDAIKRYEIARDPTIRQIEQPCGCKNPRVFSLPCEHILHAILKSSRLPCLVDFGEQWHLSAPATMVVRELYQNLEVSIQREEHQTIYTDPNDPFITLLEEYRQSGRDATDFQKQIRIENMRLTLAAAIPPSVLPPAKKPKRGRPCKAKSKGVPRSTRRDPSEFENVEPANKWTILLYSPYIIIDIYF